MARHTVSPEMSAWDGVLDRGAGHDAKAALIFGPGSRRARQFITEVTKENLTLSRCLLEDTFDEERAGSLLAEQKKHYYGRVVRTASDRVLVSASVKKIEREIWSSDVIRDIFMNGRHAATSDRVLVSASVKKIERDMWSSDVLRNIFMSGRHCATSICLSWEEADGECIVPVPIRMNADFILVGKVEDPRTRENLFDQFFDTPEMSYRSWCMLVDNLGPSQWLTMERSSPSSPLFLLEVPEGAA